MLATYVVGGFTGHIRGGAALFENGVITQMEGQNGFPAAPADPVQLRVTRDGAICWVQQPNGFVRLNAEGTTVLPPNELLVGQLTDADLAPDGTYWFTSWAGAVQYDPRSRKVLNTFSPQKMGLPSGSGVLWRVQCDDQGGVWFGQWGEGVVRWDGKQFERLPQVPGKWILQFFRDPRDGTVWTCSDQGAIRYDGNKFEQPIVFRKGRLPNSVVQNMYRDSSGGLWFATEGGAARFDGQNWSTLDLQETGVAPTVFAIAEDAREKRTMYFGTSDGLVVYRPLPHPPAGPRLIVQTDREYDSNFADMQPLAQGGLVSVRFQVADFKSRPENRLFRWLISPGRRYGPRAADGSCCSLECTGQSYTVRMEHANQPTGRLQRGGSVHRPRLELLRTSDRAVDHFTGVVHERVDYGPSRRRVYRLTRPRLYHHHPLAEAQTRGRVAP